MILCNALRTPDGTIIESTFRHDYVTHKDANGSTYMVDGGVDYLRRSANGDEVDLSIALKEGDHEYNRQHFRWGTYGVDGDQPLKRIALKDMEDDHIKAILDTQSHISYKVKDLFEEEIKYRG